MSDNDAQAGRNLAFVAEKQIPPSEPPVRASGLMLWGRENLFSSPLNIVLTVLSLGLIVWIVPPVFKWAFVDAVWSAGNLKECREINPDGACWAMVNARFGQYVFGFYPPELVWRPILTFVLMCVALAPVLFDKVPRKLLILTALFPFIAYWLIWGGSLWYVVGIILGPVVGWLAFGPVMRIGGMLPAIIISILFTVLWWAIGVDVFKDILSASHPDRSRAGCLRSPRRVSPDLHHRCHRHCRFLPARRCSGPRPAVGHDLHQGGLGDVHRVHPWRAADHASVRRLHSPELLPAAWHHLRSGAARADHGDACSPLPIWPRWCAAASQRCPRGSTKRPTRLVWTIGNPCA